MKTKLVDFSAIKGFNREWAAVTAMRNRDGRVYGWSMVTACDPSGRHFPNSHWDDSRGAAIHALETHKCKRPE